MVASGVSVGSVTPGLAPNPIKAVNSTLRHMDSICQKMLCS